MPTLQRITIFPIKSLDGVEVSSATVLPSGALQGDRQFALVDGEGKIVNGKRFASIQRIRATYSENIEQVTLSAASNESTFVLAHDHEAISCWFSEHLNITCQLIANYETGYPDDLESSGPTLISTSTLSRIGNWFEGADLNEMRRRFRTNLEIDECEAFWEDQLVSNNSGSSLFSIGSTSWIGKGICQRCSVPVRDSFSGEPTPAFAREFSKRRQESLPEWSPKTRFDHFYRAAINTSLESLADGNRVQVGDPVTLQRRCVSG